MTAVKLIGRKRAQRAGMEKPAAGNPCALVSAAALAMEVVKLDNDYFDKLAEQGPSLLQRGFRGLMGGAL